MRSFANESIQKPVWANTSPSGCHSGSCLHPIVAASSGKYFIQPQSRRKFNPADIFIPLSRSFFHSSYILSGARFSGSIVLHSSTVSEATDISNRAANCIALNTLRGSSRNRSDVWRSIFKRISLRPSNGSIISPVSQSHKIAFMVKSRREHASFVDIMGSHSTSKALWPSPVFLSRRGMLTSMW